MNMGDDKQLRRRLLDQFQMYPISIDGIQPRSDAIKAKVAVVAHLSQLTGGFNALDVEHILCKELGISEKIPGLYQACQMLKIRIDSMTDYNIVQYNFENSPAMQIMNNILMRYFV